MQALRVICLSGSLFYRNPAPIEADRLQTLEDDERKLILSHTAPAGSPSGSFVYQGTCFIKIGRRLRQSGFEHWKDGERKLILSHTALAGRHCESTYQGTRCIQIRRLLRQTGF